MDMGNKAFNKIKKAQADPMQELGGVMPPMEGGDMGIPEFDMGMEESDMGMEEDNSQFTLPSLIEYIDDNPQQAMNELRTRVSNNESVDEHGETFEPWSVLDADEWQRADDEMKGKVAGMIMNMLPREDKLESENDSLQLERTSLSIKQTVSASNEAIKKIAIQYTLDTKTKKSKSFNNLNKESQSRALQHSLVFGPDSARIFPTVQTVGNDWHIMERNKGWGKNIQEFYGIDYEQVWRENMMDKYYPEARDKDGNWVGGYIADRFEIDRNVPEANKIQLKPGQIRKERPVQHGLMEGRLSYQRETGEGKVLAFNKLTTKTASVGKKKVARSSTCKCSDAKDVGHPDNLRCSCNNGELKLSYEEPGASKGPGLAKTCPSCNATNASIATKCNGCGMPMKGVISKPVPNRAIRPGETPSYFNPSNTPKSVHRNQRVASIPVDEEDEKDYEDNNPAEFKQLADPPEHDPHYHIQKELKHRADISLSFNTLCGDPE